MAPAVRTRFMDMSVPLRLSRTPRMERARTSSKMATEIICWPTTVLILRRSMRIRMLTGRAVMATQSPIKSVDGRSWPNPMPTAMPLRMGMVKAVIDIIMLRPLRDRRISSMLISSPARITSKKIPSSEMTLISSVRCIRFSRLGPKRMPARISPIMAGWRNRSSTSPNRRAATNRMSRLVKKGNSWKVSICPLN